jgi:hypothetical protein
MSQNINQDQMKGQMPKILITGAGRSGTAYISSLTGKLGLDMPHELQMGRNGIVSWLLAAQTEDVPWGPKFSKCEFDVILHQVRHPLKTISTMRTAMPASWRYIQKNAPSIKREDSVLSKSMKYWVHWNLKAEAMSSWTYRIEDFDLKQFCEKIHSPKLFNKRNRKRVNRLPTTINSRLRSIKKYLMWEDLRQEDENLCDLIQDQAKRYGYEV